jgi:hypothetical protein
MHRFPHAAAEDLYEVLYERGNVLPALSQRRQQERKDIQPIVEITPELGACDHLSQIPIGCSDEANINLVSSTASESLELLFLQHTQQFWL